VRVRCACAAFNGDVADRARHLRARVQAGELDQDLVRARALLGDEVAALATGLPPLAPLEDIPAVPFVWSLKAYQRKRGLALLRISNPVSWTRGCLTHAVSSAIQEELGRLRTGSGD
jgi:hypothetical protein